MHPQSQSQSYDEWFKSNYFRAADVSTPIDLTIKDIHLEEMRDGAKKPCVGFVEDPRRVVLNVTNKNWLKQTTKSNSPADAVGLRVRLVSVESEFQGKPCPALRFRSPSVNGQV